MLLPTTPDRLQTIQAALQEEFMQGGAAAAEVKNVWPALSLQGDVLEFPQGSGNYFRVSPTPYTAGLRLRDLMRRLTTARRVKPATAESLRDTEACMDEAVRWFKRLSRPLNAGLRAFWFLPWVNPYRACSDADVSQLLVFFYSWTTRSGVRFYPATGSAPAP